TARARSTGAVEQLSPVVDQRPAQVAVAVGALVQRATRVGRVVGVDDAKHVLPALDGVRVAGALGVVRLRALQSGDAVEIADRDGAGEGQTTAGRGGRVGADG